MLESKVALGPNPRVLMIWPKFPPSFWSFADMMRIMPEATLMPPLGLLTVAALCPAGWELRLIDQTVRDLEDSELEWADLVMVSGMHVQKEGIREALARARALGRRTMIGGPYASAEPERFLELADHVVVGEPDEAFPRIAADLEAGTALPLYRITDKPDITKSPLPRYDLIRASDYHTGAVQFSRGCPFQCEFCDIITIYGRKPRTKRPEQVLAELDQLNRLGWHKSIFIVDDNFIGNHHRALELCRELESWQKRNDYPCLFYTEASINLAERPELMDAMVRANFFLVFIGIETPAKEAITEARKFQNLRVDPAEAIRDVQRAGLWVMGGFIVGFDADKLDVFEVQREFIERTSIPWAMTGFLQAIATTPLWDRLERQGRLFTENTSISNFSTPNFRTTLPRQFLLEGLRNLIASLYDADAFLERVYRSLQEWDCKPAQRHYPTSLLFALRVIALSILHQGILSDYRRAYWRLFFRLFRRWALVPQKLKLGLFLLFSGHHFIRYARTVVRYLDEEAGKPAPATHEAPAGARTPDLLPIVR